MTIEKFGNGYTVFYNGDEVYFSTEEEAKKFIDECGKEKTLDTFFSEAMETVKKEVTPERIAEKIEEEKKAIKKDPELLKINEEIEALKSVKNIFEGV